MTPTGVTFVAFHDPDGTDGSTRMWSPITSTLIMGRHDAFWSNRVSVSPW
ncbi:MAG TPA: hypothetical protein VFC01_24640 [Mycobacterium sp.]|nr:hypothetical protein [Mycobacterium sp.]